MATAKNKNVAKEEEVKNEEVVKEETTEETGVVVQQTEAAMINNADEEELEFDLDELDELSGLDGLRPGDFRVPYAKLFQKRKTLDTKQTVDIGDLLLPNGDIIYGIKEGQKLDEVCVLKTQTVRVYFPEKYTAGDTTIICRSRDAIVGAPDGEYAGQECATCEFAKFPESGASPCREQKLLLCTLPDGTLFHYLVSGVGVKEFKDQFLSVELQKGLRLTQKRFKNKRGVMAALNLSLSIKEKTTPNGPVAVPVFTMIEGQEIVSNARLNSNLAAYKSYKTFEEEAIDTAATFASQQQEDTPERSEEDEAVKNSVNNQMF